MARPDESPEEMFQRTLRMEAEMAHTLTAGGISTLEELAYVPLNELLEVKGLAESDAQRLRALARKYLLDDVMGRPG